jgi:hypothetical protein
LFLFSRFLTALYIEQHCGGVIAVEDSAPESPELPATLCCINLPGISTGESFSNLFSNAKALHHHNVYGSDDYHKGYSSLKR